MEISLTNGIWNSSVRMISACGELHRILAPRFVDSVDHTVDGPLRNPAPPIWDG